MILQTLSNFWKGVKMVLIEKNMCQPNAVANPFVRRFGGQFALFQRRKEDNTVQIHAGTKVGTALVFNSSFSQAAAFRPDCRKELNQRRFGVPQAQICLKIQRLFTAT